MLKVFKCHLLLAALIAMVYSLASCTSAKKVVYLYDIKDTTAGSLHQAQKVFENLIQANDQLSITVSGSNPLDLPALNQSVSSAGGAGGSASGGAATVSGYLVEGDGTIKIPYVGKYQAAGLTRLELENKLTTLYSDYTKNPIVNVRFLNYNFSVLGEVANKGRFPMPNERITILEAISMAGDLTDMARRDNILVVREVDRERNFMRVNLLSKDLFKSPYFYLKTNDVVYVEPVKAKFITRSGLTQYFSFIAIGFTLLVTLLNLRK